MAPKKRPRKKTATSSSKHVVPLKKRRTLYDPSLYLDGPDSPLSEVTNTELPEWFKLSIQILLINFYPEGVAILNNLEADYEALFKGAKLDATDYNFSDWESMLRSPQFKKHCLVYVDKRITYCKGFPLPRSAAVTMRNGVWEICPKYDRLDQDLDQKDAEQSTSSPSPTKYSGKTLKIATSASSTNINKNKPENGHATEFESMNNFGRFDEEEGNDARSTPRSPSSEREVEVEKKSHRSRIEREMPKLPLVIPAEEVKSIVCGESQSRSPIPQPKSPARLANEKKEQLPKSDLDMKQNNPEPTTKLVVALPENDLVDISNDEEDLSPSTNASSAPSKAGEFVRRVDIRDSGTNVLEKHHEENGVLENAPNLLATNGCNKTEETLLANTDCPPSVEESTVGDQKINGQEVVEQEIGEQEIGEQEIGESDSYIKAGATIMIAEELMIIHDAVDSSPIPQSPPSESAPPSPSTPPPPSPSPPPPRLSPQIIFEKNTSERVKERRQVMMMRDPRKLYISNSSLRLSEGGGIPTFTTNPRNDPPRPERSDSFTSTESDQHSSTSGSEPEVPESNGVTEYMPWKCTVVDIPGLELAYLQVLEKAVDDGKVQNVHRDPRLNIGKRASHFTFLPKVVGVVEEEGELGEIIEKEEDPVVEDTNDKVTVGVENGKNTSALESERRVRLALMEMAQSGPRINQSEGNDDGFSQSEPNLSITIRNTNRSISQGKDRGRGVERGHHRGERGGRGEEQPLNMFVPIEKVHQFDSHLYIEDPIPQEAGARKYLKCSDLWSNVVWKDRLKADTIPPKKFFSSDIFERWLNLKKRELSPMRNELIRELQKYEDKVFPSRCDFYLRTALRMVELDYRTDHQFSEPRSLDGKSLVGPDEILFYIDFTGAPGGVVEFYNKSRKLNSKGFGVTYQKRCYNLNAIPDIYPDFFEPFYGKLNGYNGDGNLFIQETVDTFVNRVMEATDGKGVHIVSTLGNIVRVVFEDNNDDNWKFQHLAQTLMSLLLLREGGNLVLKMYDLKNSFSVGLVFLLYHCFESVAICKLNIFAPTSSERAIVCLRRRSFKKIDGIIQFLKKCHRSLMEWYEKNKRKTYNNTIIEELVPFTTLIKHEEFMTYIRSSNERIKRIQIEELYSCLTNLRKNGSIFTPGSYRALVARTTELWKVPSRTSYCSYKDKLVDSRNPLTAFRELRVPDNVCDSLEANLNEFNLYSVFSSAEHWRFSPVGNKIKTRGFYLGVEGIPHFFNMKSKEWVPVHGNEFRLPSRSLLYGEIVSIFTKDGFSVDEVFTIIDALVLAGVEIKNLTYAERLCECEKFAMAVTRTFFPKMTKLVVTRSFDFVELSNFLEGVVASPEDNEAFRPRNVNNSIEVKQITPGKLRIPANCGYKLRGRSKDEDLWFSPSGILFFEAGSNSKDFCSSLLSRIFWEWVETGMDIPLPKPNYWATDSSGEELRPIGSVSAKKLIEFAQRYS